MPLDDLSKQTAAGGSSFDLNALLKGGEVAFGPSDGGNGSTVTAPQPKTHARSEP